MIVRGTVQRTRDGRYRPRLPPQFGRRWLEPCATEVAARAALVVELEHLSAHPPEALTLGTWIEDWITARREDGHHRSTRTDDARARAYVRDDRLGRTPLVHVTAGDVRAWLRRLSRLAPQTQRNALHLVRAALAAAVDAGEIRENPAREVRVPRAARAAEGGAWTWLRLEEQERLLAVARELAAEGPSARAAWPVAITVALYTGLRAGELWALRWDAIDLGRGIVAVREAVGEDGRPGPPKSRAARREVILLEPAARALRAWETAREGSRSEYVLPATDDGPHGRGYAPGWSRVLERLGLGRRLRWHDLRHTCASALLQGHWAPGWLERPLRLEEVQQWLGHGSRTTTERYAHLAADGLVRLRAVYGGAEPGDETTARAGFPKPKVAGSNPAGGAADRGRVDRVVGSLLAELAAARERYLAAVEVRDPHAHARGAELATVARLMVEALAGEGEERAG